MSEHTKLKDSFIIPDYVGKYYIGHLQSGDADYYNLAISLIKKPNWLHRFCMKFFLGWEWSDN